jgi:hypothetical protein
MEHIAGIERSSLENLQYLLRNNKWGITDF